MSFVPICITPNCRSATDLKNTPHDTKVDFTSYVIPFICITYLLTYLLTPHSTVLLQKLTGSAASQEIPHILCNPKVHHRIHKCPPAVHIRSQFDPVHNPTSHYLEIHLNIILPSTFGSPNWSLSFRFPHRNPVHASHLPHTRYMSRPSHSSRFHILYLCKNKNCKLIIRVNKDNTMMLFTTTQWCCLQQHRDIVYNNTIMLFTTTQLCCLQHNDIVYNTMILFTTTQWYCLHQHNNIVYKNTMILFTTKQWCCLQQHNDTVYNNTIMLFKQNNDIVYNTIMLFTTTQWYCLQQHNDIFTTTQWYCLQHNNVVYNNTMILFTTTR